MLALQTFTVSAPVRYVCFKSGKELRRIPQIATCVGRKKPPRSNLVAGAERTPTIALTLTASQLLKTACNSNYGRFINVQENMQALLKVKSYV